MNLEVARTVADAVLVEGYAPSPARASAPKNRCAFGVLAPRAWSEANDRDAWWLESQVLVAPGTTPRLTARLRLFQIERRTLEGRDDVPGFAWDEGVLREAELAVDLDGPSELTLAFDGTREVTTSEPGRIIRERLPLTGRIAISVTRIAAPKPLVRVAVRVENTTPWHASEASRDKVMTAAFASTHLLLGVTGGELLSLLDPPSWAREAAATCSSVGTFPVLAGPPRGTRDIALSSPFAIADHPHVVSAR